MIGSIGLPPFVDIPSPYYPRYTKRAGLKLIEFYKKFKNRSRIPP
jgi:hypothetical protein